MERTVKLIEQYEKFAKRGKKEKFYEYLQEEGLIKKFIAEVFNTTYGGYIPEDKRKKAMELTDFALQITRDEWMQKYGENLTNRFQEMIGNINHPSERIFHIYSLERWGLQFTSKEQMDAAEDILDLASIPGNVIGVHGTGAELGEEIMKEGLRLTGDLNEAYIRKDTKEILSRNIELFKGNRPLDVFERVIDYSGWNKKEGTTCSDMVIVSIPEEELNQENGEIIKRREDNFKYLDPKYIYGYAKVQRTPLPLDLVSLTRNPLFIQESTREDEKTPTISSPIEQSINGTKLYAQTIPSRLQGIKEKFQKIMGIFKGHSQETENDDRSL